MAGGPSPLPFTCHDGGYDFTLVSVVPDDCICSICSKILKSPYLTECCGQDYCESCIGHWLQVCANQTCPQCRSAAFRYIQDKKMERRIRDLEVYCPHQEEGCGWTGELSLTASHFTSEDGCPFVVVECRNKCGKKLPRKELKAHVDAICPLRIVSCQYCHQTGSYESIMTEHYDQCLQTPIPCTNDCGKLVTRNNLRAHLENECSSRCPFHRAGCSATVAYKDLEAHTASCKHLPKAFLLLQGEMDSLKSQLQSVQVKNKTLSKDLARAKSEIVAAQEKLTEQTQLISNTVTTELGFILSSHAQATQTEALAMECIKTRLGSDAAHLQCEAAPVTFRMSNYAEHKETSLVWYTPPFFITSGYKMCLAVHLNGFGVGRGTHLSVCLHQMVGEFDSDLLWPFYFDEMMEVRLLQQCEGPKRSWRDKAFHHHSESAKTLPSEHERRDSRLKSLSLSRHTLPQPSKLKLRRAASPGSPPVGEIQQLRISAPMHQVADSRLPAGPVVGKLELFCLQGVVEGMVHRDTLVFQCAVKQCNLTASILPGAPTGAHTKPPAS